MTEPPFVGQPATAAAADSGTPEHPSARILTIPNLLSLLRLVLVPVFLAFIIRGEFIQALIVLIIASLSDAFDGYLARRLNQVSNLGILLDPMADRLYIFATLIGLAFQGFVPWWLLGVILARDVLIVVLGVVLWRGGEMGRRGEEGRFRRGAIPVTKLGKTATFLLFSGLPVIMLSVAFDVQLPWLAALGWTITIVGTVLYWAAGIDYARRTRMRVKKVTSSASEVSDRLAGEDVQ